VIDATGHGQTAVAVPHAEPLGDVAEDVDPTCLARDLRIDEGEGGVQAGMAIGGDQAQRHAGEAAAGEINKKGLPGRLAFLPDEAVVEEFAAAGGGEAIGDEGVAPAGTVRRFDAERDGIEEEVVIVIGEAAGMKGRHGVIEGLGDLRHGGGADRVAQEGGEGRADAAGTEAAEEDGADEAIHLLRALLVARHHGGPEATIPGARNLEIRNGPPGGGEVPAIGPIPVADAAMLANIPASMEIVVQLIVHAVLQKQLDRPQRLLRDVAPQRVRILS
jgi:hypothetical protein